MGNAMATDTQYEKGVLSTYDASKLKSVATAAELSRLRAAARATLFKRRRPVRASGLRFGDARSGRRRVD
jgi:hypothetical protein